MSTATIEQPATERDEWLAWRSTGLGASDLPAIMGICPYRTPLDVFMEKTGRGTPQPESLAMFLGKQAEPKIAADYEAATGHTLKAQQVRMESKSLPFMRATLDALRDDGLPVEMKLVLGRSLQQFGEEGTDALPDSFLVQGMAQLFVAEADRMDFAVASPAWGALRVYPVERDEALVRLMLDRAEEMWDRILRRDPPPFTTPADIRYAPALWHDDALTTAFTDEEADLWARYVDLGRVASGAEKERAAIKLDLFNRLGSASSGVLPTGDRIAVQIINRKEQVVKATTYAQLRHIKQGK